MECYNKIRVKIKEAGTDKPHKDFPDGMLVDCGKCLNCLANKALNKAMRVLHEAETTDEKGNKIYKVHFLTFTYSDENPDFIYNENNILTLKKEMVRKKRDKIYSRFYRRYIKSKKTKEYHKSYKYMIAGEYGEEGTKRPHYHMIILTKKYHSKIIHEFIKEFSGGRTDVQTDVPTGAIFYVAGYTAKKIGKELEREDIENPFLICSRGLGKEWLHQQSKYILEKGYISIHTKKAEIKKRIPRIYLEWLVKYNWADEYDVEMYKKNMRDYNEEFNNKEQKRILGEYHFRKTGMIFDKYQTINIPAGEIFEGYGGSRTDRYINIITDKGQWYNSKYEDYRVKKNKILKLRAEKRLLESYQRKISKYVKYE